MFRSLRVLLLLSGCSAPPLAQSPQQAGEQAVPIAQGSAPPALEPSVQSRSASPQKSSTPSEENSEKLAGHVLLRSPLDFAGEAPEQKIVESDERAIVSAAINHPDFKNFGAEDSNGRTVFILLMEDPPDVRGLTRGEDPVVLLSEPDCLRFMLTQFFEVKELKVDGDRASAEYSYPNGAHFGTLLFERTATGWTATKGRTFRSSSGRRARLKSFYERIPHPRVPGGERSLALLRACDEGDAESCKSYAVFEGNAGRLEAAELLYARACKLNEVESCHNLAMLHVKGGKKQQGLRELSRLCEKEGIELSCKMRTKYGTEEGEVPDARDVGQRPGH